MCISTSCGNGSTEAHEECDEGDIDPEDGCNSFCLIERCGNRILELVEQCDDGNTTPGDGCSHECFSERCGDGQLDTDLGEQCDHGDVIDGDGCSSHCLPETCGNGIIDGKEECDDGPGASAICNDDCTIPRCGDRKVNQTALEECDDGRMGSARCNLNCTIPICGDGIVNLLALNDATDAPDDLEACDSVSGEDTPGCNANCTLPVCGDGYYNRLAFNTGTYDVIDDLEQCDDGGNSQDCNANCTISRCGDGFLNPANGEECDDGNASTTDDCPDGAEGTCQAATCGDGFRDQEGPNTEACDTGTRADSADCDLDCSSVLCGDGHVNTAAGEVCDDGNFSTTDACPDGPGMACQLARCGDGFVRTGDETCDDGDGNNNDDCPDGLAGTCRPAFCGDGFRDQQGPVTEACDTGADSATCDFDCSAAICGDGYINSAAGEQCDDDNATDGDGCSGNCQDEGPPPPPPPPPPASCGDSVVQPDEECDLGLSNSNDPNAPCRTNCQDRDCGDFIIDDGFGEQCDDGTAADSASCDSDCSAVSCGDGNLNLAADEECDDGNRIDGDNCSSTCQVEGPPPPPPSCGDNIIQQPPEQCDDGNNNLNDDCPSGPGGTCQDARCGDGFLDQQGPDTEACDDGNNTDGDDCPSNCQVEPADPLVMGCYIDSEAKEIYTPMECYRFGGDSSSTASFKVLNIVDISEYEITWGEPGCSTSSESCSVPISIGGRITVAATVRHTPTNETVTLSAIAIWDIQ